MPGKLAFWTAPIGLVAIPPWGPLSLSSVQWAGEMKGSTPLAHSLLHWTGGADTARLRGQPQAQPPGLPVAARASQADW